MKKNSLYLVGGIIIVIIIVLIILNYSKSKEHFRNRHYKDDPTTKSNNNPNVTHAPGSGGEGGGGGPCFFKDSLLKLENGEKIRIEDAKIGDKILSYSLNKNSFVYSPIVAIPHEKNSIESNFIEIKTLSGKNIKMTPDHLIPVLKNKNKKFETIYAENIDVDDIIITIDGNDKVISKEVMKEDGIYTVITLEEYIVVDDIVASPYGIFHILGNIYYSLHKTLYRINPSIVKSTYFEKFNKNNNVFYNKVISMF